MLHTPFLFLLGKAQVPSSSNRNFWRKLSFVFSIPLSDFSPERDLAVLLSCHHLMRWLFELGQGARCHQLLFISLCRVRSAAWDGHPGASPTGSMVRWKLSWLWYRGVIYREGTGSRCGFLKPMLSCKWYLSQPPFCQKENGTVPGFHRWAGAAWARAELLSALLQGPGLSSAGAWLKPLKSELVPPRPLQSNICVCVGTFVLGSSVAKSALMVAGEDEEIGKKGFFKKPISVAALCNSALRSTGCPAWLPPREITYLAGNNKKGKAVPSVLPGYVLKSVNLNL